MIRRLGARRIGADMTRAAVPAALVLSLLACDAEDSAPQPTTAAADGSGKADDADPPADSPADDADDADGPSPSTIVLPLPEIQDIRGTWLGLLEAAADSVQRLDASGALYGLAPEDCPDIEAIYGEPGRELCEDGVLAVPLGAAYRLPRPSEGVIETWAQSPDAAEPDLGHPMLIVDLEAGALLVPELVTMDGSRREQVDVVRRIQIDAETVRVWSRDPANPEGPPLAGELQHDPHALAVMVLPDDAPQTKAGALADYDFTLALRCEAEADCRFVRPD